MTKVLDLSEFRHIPFCYSSLSFARKEKKRVTVNQSLVRLITSNKMAPSLISLSLALIVDTIPFSTLDIDTNDWTSFLKLK